MKITHSCVKSSLFEHVNTFEIDIEFSDDSFILRIELFRSLSDRKLYRYKIYRSDMFTMQPMFPQENGNPLGPSHETIFVNWGLFYFSNTEFRADNNKKAFDRIIEDLGKALEHVSGEKMKSS